MIDNTKAMAKLQKKMEEKPKGWDGEFGEGASIVPDLVKPPKKRKGRTDGANARSIDS